MNCRCASIVQAGQVYRTLGEYVSHTEFVTQFRIIAPDVCGPSVLPSGSRKSSSVNMNIDQSAEQERLRNECDKLVSHLLPASATAATNGGASGL
jgi:hypothetical protein